MKAQERERLKQEEQRIKIEKKRKNSRMYRFSQIHGVGNPRGRPQPQASAHSLRLSAQREMIRKQLEDGVEAMYQEAVRFYNQGQYPACRREI